MLLWPQHVEDCEQNGNGLVIIEGLNMNGVIFVYRVSGSNKIGEIKVNLMGLQYGIIIINEFMVQGRDTSIHKNIIAC